MEQEILEKFQEQDKKLDAIFKSAEKTRKIFLWTLIITAVTIVLPLLVLPFVASYFLQSINPAMYGL